MNDDGEDWAICFDNFFHHETSRNTIDSSHRPRLAVCQKSELEVRPESEETAVSGHAGGAALSPTHPSCHSTTTSCSVSYHTDCSLTANHMHLVTCQVSDTTVYQTHKEEDDEDEDDDDGFKGMSRSERKRSREKQRRSDFNQQFSELKDVLGKIEEAEEGRTDDKRQRRTLKSASAKNRQDLIAHAIDVLHHLHSKNQDQIKEIQELKREIEKLKQKSSKIDTDAAAESAEKTPEEKREQVSIMMMPMMMPQSSSMGGGVSVANPMAMCNPFMQQMQQFMAHMASQSALMYPYMAPMAFPPSSQMPSYPTPHPMQAPNPFATLAPEGVQSSAGSHPSALPNHSHLNVPVSLQQQREQEDRDCDPNANSSSADLAHCA